MSNSASILVVEDKESEREAMARLLRMEKHDVLTAPNPEKALEYINEPVSLVVTDLRMGASSGVDLLRRWKQHSPATPFIMVTAHGDVESAVEAMKLGAEDYLNKPVNPDELLILVRKVLESRQKDEKIQHLQQRLDHELGFSNIVGHSKPMQDVFEQARRAAPVDTTVLITGESGTGKELIAHAVHQHSSRRDEVFVTVNMAAVPEHLVESELFGHIKGAFTGATNPRVGRFEAAHRGTIFIDEIGDFALASQAKLLRALENRTITPIGSNDDKEVDVRVVAATSRDLEEMVADGDFREDLYYRLNVITIPLPPLRVRRDDIPLLVQHFLRRFCESNNRPLLTLDPDLVQFFQTYDWPGNVRQLRNCVESMVVMAANETLTIDDLPSTISDGPSNGDMAIPAGTTLEQLERTAVEQALEQFDGNRTQAADALGISVRTLQRKLKAWNGEQREQQPHHVRRIGRRHF
ncbi:MAG: sigma-54 dependent transcriptional regulator [Pirellulales bacterium]